MKKLWCDGWSFALTEPNSDRTALENAHWYDVEIPHDWLIGDTANLYKSGCGWYKKTFRLTSEEAKSSYILCFDGVYMDSTVYLNGEKVGEWKYGYTSFDFDITEYIREGENEVMVRVNYVSPNSRWYSGAGIYRNVYLRRTSREHILTDGVYFSAKALNCQPNKSVSRWKVSIDTELCKETDGQIRHILTAPDGRQAAEICGPVAGSVHHTEFFTDSPLLWSTDSPNLYTLKTFLLSNRGETLDESECRVGFRTVRFDPASGLYLNGKHIKLNGVCLHHDLGALGAAVNRDAIKRQLRIMADMGVNAIRTSHNPPARETAELCDEMGLLMDSEFCDVWEEAKTEYDYSRFFPEWYKKDVRAWITRDRNHPCVIMWSIGNEIHDTHKSERGLEVAQALVDEIKKYDRRGNAKPTIGSNYMGWENAQKVADLLKAAGYNYSERLYKEHHAANPDWYIYGSETASTVRSRGIYHFPYDCAQLTHDDMQCSDLGNSVVNWGASPFDSYRMDRDCKFSLGQFVWTGFDYIGEPTPYSSKNSFFGITDTAGFPKESYWFYKAVWNKKDTEPFIRVMPYWDYNEGQTIDVIAYSNLSVLVLEQDGKKSDPQYLDLAHGDKFCAQWQVKYSAASNIKVYGYTDGRAAAENLPAVCETLCGFSEPVKIIVNADRTSVKADGRSLCFAEISVEDKNGRAVPNANDRIKLTVSGAGRLVGTDNGDSTDYDSYKNDNRRLFSGRLLAIIQSTFDSGDIVLTAESDGLESASLTVHAEPCDIPEGVSVVTENLFEPKVTPYVPEKPIRKIELSDGTSRHFDPEHTEHKVGVRLLPADAEYRDISFKCASASGEEVNFAEACDFDGENVTVKAKGDGEFRLRAYAYNGGDIPRVISELEYSITDMGSAVTDAYRFTAATLCNYTDVPLNNIGGGSFGLNGKATLGFFNTDFGKAGANRITLTVGYCGSQPLRAALYIGDPADTGRQVGEFELSYNNGWDRGYPQEFTLPEIIKGINDVYIEIDGGCIFGGISFSEYNRAYSLNYAADCDKLYGDDYTVSGKRITDIGNNVVIEFDSLDFGDGARTLTVTGRTPLDVNTVQIRATDKDGVQTAQIIEFPHSDDYRSVKFDIEKISGVKDISFVFLPGVKFDMESFEFGE